MHRSVPLDPETLLSAYAQGAFPMADRDGAIRWYTADPRGVIPLDERFHVPATLAALVRQNKFECRINSDFGGNVVRVEGHTDSDPIKKQKGKYKDNEELSAERALAVERYLVGRGVASSQIYAAAFGPASPKGSKKASRRVEIVILTAK
jgi:hypothetical protein